MAEALILDSEALNALAHPTERGALAERARAILATAYERRALIRVPAPVLAEVCRGPRFDAAVNHVLNNKGIAVFDLTRDVAQRAGRLLAKAKLASEHAVDAFVSTALEFDSAVIATGDPMGIKRLLGSSMLAWSTWLTSAQRCARNSSEDASSTQRKRSTAPETCSSKRGGSLNGWVRTRWLWTPRTWSPSRTCQIRSRLSRGT